MPPSERITPGESPIPSAPGGEPPTEQPTVSQPGAEVPPERGPVKAEGTDEILGSKSDYVIIGTEPP
ncbi:MAG TPA: hypothetical protein VFK85_02130 [Anaeromyxobacteraceae bacterium]|nr:hypothetical protein [Anaeromyxobacteraceae bacterium]